MNELPVDLVFHPVPTDSTSDAFAAALRQVLDAASGEICLVSPYLSANVLARIVGGRTFRLVTDVDACFEGGAEQGLIAFLFDNIDHVHDLPGVHAKVVISGVAALIGSANLTNQGFGVRDEMGCILREPSLVLKLQCWFDALFEFAQPVTVEHIASAAERGRALAATRQSADRTGDHRAPRGGRGQRTLGWMTRPPASPHPGIPPAPTALSSAGSEPAIPFIGDDAGYMAWLSAHPEGFVVNTYRSKRPDYMVLHRANCSFISSPTGRMSSPGGFTERSLMKICAASVSSLREWVSKEGRSDETFSRECSRCNPT